VNRKDSKDGNVSPRNFIEISCGFGGNIFPLSKQKIKFILDTKIRRKIEFFVPENFFHVYLIAGWSEIASKINAESYPVHNFHPE
jgi:hypothetical protein